MGEALRLHIFARSRIGNFEEIIGGMNWIWIDGRDIREVSVKIVASSS